MFNRVIFLKRVIGVLLDAGAGALASVASLEMINPGSTDPAKQWPFFAAAVVLTGSALGVAGVYRIVVSHMGLGIFFRVSGAMLGSSLVLGTLAPVAGLNVGFPSLLFFFFISTFLISGWRLAVMSLAAGNEQGERVLIYGAGRAGVQLAAALQRSKEFHPIAFVDDSPSLKGRTVGSLSVYPADELEELVNILSIKRILLALPSASRSCRQSIVGRLASLPVKISTVPSFADIISGSAKVDQIRPVSIEDLLGRDAVMPNPKLLMRAITGKGVLVTGAGGSIGSELCRQIAQLEPRFLVIFENNEFALYRIEKELRTIVPSMEIVPILGSARDSRLLRELFETYRIDTVYHAAAHKHVPLVEQNTIEAVGNNVFSTLAIATQAVASGAERFILISTDKAVRPTSVMGASKRLAEMVVQALAEESPESTRIGIVRFGNVLGSSGSVVPLFRDQIMRGGPVTVTHPDIVRYFMTIPEAVQLVIQSSTMVGKGDVFVLDMGEPVRIYELARRMIELSGREVRDTENPNGDIEIIFSGLRPGEKLYEELLIGGNVTPTLHSRIKRAQEEFTPWPVLQEKIAQLSGILQAGDRNELRLFLGKTVNGYTPAEPVDLLLSVQINKYTNEMA